jgi:hypothetical protein
MLGFFKIVLSILVACCLRLSLIYVTKVYIVVLLAQGCIGYVQLLVEIG